MERFLALELASTVRHDGHGGVADDLDGPDGLTAWVREREAVLDAAGFAADGPALAEVLALRAAVRALFARAVSPAPPSPADANRLLPLPEALARVNAAAARYPVAPQLGWPDGEPPVARHVGPEAEPVVRICAALARAAVAFLTGPDREQLRACTAPRCVRYFVKGHGRQEYCKPSCSNRARVARHYARTRGVGGGWDDEGVVSDQQRS